MSDLFAILLLVSVVSGRHAGTSGRSDRLFLARRGSAHHNRAGRVPDEQLEFDFTLFDAWVEAFSRPRGGSRKTYIEGQPIAWRKGYDGHVKARIWRIVEGQPQQAIIEVKEIR